MKEQKARNCVKSCKMFASVESFKYFCRYESDLSICSNGSNCSSPLDCYCYLLENQRRVLNGLQGAGDWSFWKINDLSPRSPQITSCFFLCVKRCKVVRFLENFH